MLKIDILGLNSPSSSKVYEADSAPHPECDDCKSIFFPSGPIDYHAPPQKRLWLFIVPEFIGFACMGLMVYYGRSKKG